MQSINTIGRRKEAVARVYLNPGNGAIKINGKEFKDFFPNLILQYTVTQPFKISELEDKFDTIVNVKGGGIKGQAEAVRMAISRAICDIDPEKRPALKEEGFLRRDSRVVERKKPGQKKARKKFQFSKR
ncbi:MAG: small subunit ribosomal protein S9 [Sphingobacteriales bacterium]|jgi:small subunit ribosomal protein S9